MRPGEGDQVGAAGGEDGVDLVGAGDVAHRHGRDAELVADLVGERRLEHAAVDRIVVGHRLAGRDVDQVRAMGGEGAGDLDRVVAGDAALLPVGGGNAHRDRLLRRPHRAHGVEHLERKAETVLEPAAIVVGAPIGQGRDEAGEQVAVSRVQLEHVETGADGACSRSRIVADDRVHLRPVELRRHLAVGQVGQGRGRDDGPVAVGQGLVHALPHEPGGALASGMAQLQADLGAAVGVHEVDDAAPGRLVGVAVDAGAAVADARRLGDGRHLGVDEPGAALRAAAQMHKVPVAGQAVMGAVLAHGRDHDPVVEHHLAQAKGREHGRRSRRHVEALARPHVAGEPAIHRIDETGVAQAQIVVGDLLRARDQAEGELQRIMVPCALHVLEPGEGDIGRVLGLRHLLAAGVLVGGEGGAHAGLCAKRPGQGNGVLHRQLGARADGEMRRALGVAEQDDVAV